MPKNVKYIKGRTSKKERRPPPMQSGTKRLIATVIVLSTITNPVISQASAPDPEVERIGGYEMVRLFNEETEIEEENRIFQELLQEEIDSAVGTEQFESWISSQKGTISIYRKNTDSKLLVKLQSNEESKIFIVKTNSSTGSNDWEHIGDISVSDILNVAYTAYWEVGGAVAKNVWTQIGVIVNRAQDADFNKGNGILGVLSARKQYSSWNMVKVRKLKANNAIERDDLNKVFQYILDYMSGEAIYIPNNVVYAATFPQGSGTWKVIDGTYYCYK